MIIAGTGHRPNKLGGYSDGVFHTLTGLLICHLEELKPQKVISGMAQGYDQALALAAIDLEIPIVAALPFDGQEAVWPSCGARRYRLLLDAAIEVVTVCEGGYSPQSMQRRNEWMVDRCDLLLALWNGTPGGTANCLAYARQVERRTHNLWSDWVKLTQPTKGES